MMSLVRMEFLKAFRRRGLLVLSLLLILLTAGALVLHRFGKGERTDYARSEADLRSAIKFYDEAGTGDAELEREKAVFLLDHKLFTMKPWQEEVFSLAFDDYKRRIYYDTKLTGTERIRLSIKSRLLLQILLDKDYTSYFRFRIEEIQNNDKLSDEEKEARIFPYQYMLDQKIVPGSEDYRESVVRRLGAVKEKLATGALYMTTQGGMSFDERQQLENEALVLQYRLDHKVPYVIGDKVRNTPIWDSVLDALFLMPFLGILLILHAAGSIGDELKSGTLKISFVQPVRRQSLFFAKVLTGLFMFLILLLLFFGISVLISGILYGFEGLNAKHLYVIGHTVHVLSGSIYVFGDYLINSVLPLTMMSLAMGLAGLIGSSTLPACLSLSVLLFGNSFALFLKNSGLEFGRFFLFSNMDLYRIAAGRGVYEGQTLTVSALNLVLHMLIFLLIAYDGFCKKEF